MLRETGEEITASVITVPALFEIPQCDATRRAAEMAGITCSPLLQEPIAAALSYGFQADSLDGFLSYMTWAEEPSMHRSFGRWKAGSE